MPDFYLPSFQQRLHEMEEAEQGPGWLWACTESQRHLVLCHEFVAALHDELSRRCQPPILEVCAGAGELAQALSTLGLEVLPADARPAADRVLPCPASEALARWQPSSVLGSFVPVDSGIDQAVFACPSVLHYVVLGARLGGQFGSGALWQPSTWRAAPLDTVNRWMLTRHDVWLGDRLRPLLQHGEAWYFERQ